MRGRAGMQRPAQIGVFMISGAASVPRPINTPIGKLSFTVLGSQHHQIEVSGGVRIEAKDIFLRFHLSLWEDGIWRISPRDYTRFECGAFKVEQRLRRKIRRAILPSVIERADKIPESQFEAARRADLIDHQVRSVNGSCMAVLEALEAGTIPLRFLLRREDLPGYESPSFYDEIKTLSENCQRIIAAVQRLNARHGDAQERRAA